MFAVAEDNAAASCDESEAWREERDASSEVAAAWAWTWEAEMATRRSGVR